MSIKEKQNKYSTKNNKSSVTLKVPQMGEGLREVRIISLLKKPGELIREDEVIYEMETEKSMVEVESPFTGYLKGWLAQEGDILNVGSILANVELINLDQGSTKITQSSSLTQKDLKAAEENQIFSIRKISPRIKAYCKKNNIKEEIILKIPYKGKALTIEEIENFISSNPDLFEEVNNIKERYFSHQQSALNFRFKQSASLNIPATIVSIMDVEKLRYIAANILNNDAQTNILITDFQIFSYLITQVLVKHSKFCSLIIDDKRFYEYKDLNLGFAVQTIHKELVTAVIPSANKLNFKDFISTIHDKLQTANQGQDQVATVTPQVILTHMGSSNIISGSAVLVTPSIATILLGSPLDNGNKQIAYLSITFDHRLINGMDVSEMLIDFENTVNEYYIKLYKTHSPLMVSDKPTKFFISSAIQSNGEVESKSNSNLKKNLQNDLIILFAEILDLNFSQINPEENFKTYGLDSIKFTKIINRLNKKTGLALTVLTCFKHPSVTLLTNYLYENYADVIGNKYE